MIPFDAWRPDLADLNTPDAKNCLPGEDGYRPLPSLQAQTNALTYYCRGAFAAKSSSNIAYNYAGDEKNLYLMSNNVWGEVNKAPGGADVYALGANENWEFTKWGENVIAVGGANATDPVPQIAALDGTDFGDLSGTPPRARHIATVRNFVVMGNLYESATAHPSRVRWSGHNDETFWGVDRAKQADYQDFPAFGWVQAIKGGDYGVIFQENAITPMIYTGPPEIFQLDTKPGVGTPAPNSVIQKGDVCYFWGQDGFYMTTNGQTPVAIGRHILDRFVRNDFDLSHPHRMVGAEDKERQLMWWIYPGVGNAAGAPNKVVILDYRLGKWSYAEICAEWVYDSLGTSIALDSFTAAGYPNLDLVTISLDSDIWKGGAITFGVFCDSHKQNQLTGTAMAAELITREVDASQLKRDLIPGRRAKVRRVRPVVQGGTTTVTPITRNDLGDNVTEGAVGSEQADGSVPLRTNARYHRFKVTTSGDYDRALGVLPEKVADGGNR